MSSSHVIIDLISSSDESSEVIDLTSCSDDGSEDVVTMDIGGMSSEDDSINEVGEDDSIKEERRRQWINIGRLDIHSMRIQQEDAITCRERAKDWYYDCEKDLNYPGNNPYFMYDPDPENNWFISMRRQNFDGEKNRHGMLSSYHRPEWTERLAHYHGEAIDISVTKNYGEEDNILGEEDELQLLIMGMGTIRGVPAYHCYDIMSSCEGIISRGRLEQWGYLVLLHVERPLITTDTGTTVISGRYVQDKPVFYIGHIFYLAEKDWLRRTHPDLSQEPAMRGIYDRYYTDADYVLTEDEEAGLDDLPGGSDDLPTHVLYPPSPRYDHEGQEI
jgi:hypothetical protein